MNPYRFIEKFVVMGERVQHLSLKLLDLLLMPSRPLVIKVRLIVSGGTHVMANHLHQLAMMALSKFGRITPRDKACDVILI